MEYLATISVMLKATVLDPQGEAVRKSLASLGYGQVQKVRVGKHLELVLEAADREAAGALVDELCHRLLSNPVIEEYSFSLDEGEGPR
ncbi:MAG TPA: phosphoribosylformylglycinamidine synthase [Clostridiales bacterium UBA8153]|nr:phosphoribosylformylglycinamidine synthase [Clostridiales bacterium UBA8153]